MSVTKIDYSLIFSSLSKLPLGIFIVSKNYTVQFWNLQMSEITGINSKDIIGKCLFDYFPVFNQKKYTMRFDWIFLGGPPAILSYQLNKELYHSPQNDSFNRVLRTTVTAVNSSENEILAMFSVEDISDLAGQIQDQKKLKRQALAEVESRKQVEASLVESGEQLQELNATKDKLFAIIAHDLKNPLGAFNKLLDSMLENYDILEEDDKLDILNSISASSKNVYELLENLLFWSRSQRGNIQVFPVRIDLVFLVNNVFSLLKKNAEDKNINLELQCSSEAFCFADVNMVNTIIRNLVSNAIKFTYENGNVKVYVEKSLDECFVNISVVDSGMGISPEMQNKLFKLDSYVSTKGTNDEKGTGLGLILCREFAEINGGKIWVDSEYGSGSRFTVSLPVNEQNI